MTGPHLVYFADPMCSWCWGFTPVIDAIQKQFGADLLIRLVMGGLRPGTTKPMDEAAKRVTREHWEHVQKASGQPFDFSFFERAKFVYDTEPTAKAVVVVQWNGMDQAMNLLKRLHVAFYAHNQDVTDEVVLAELAAEGGLDPAEFLRSFRSDEATQETWQDSAIAQKAGIRGFPSMIAGVDEGAEYKIVTMGYQPAERLLPPLERWFEIVSASPDGSDLATS